MRLTVDRIRLVRSYRVVHDHSIWRRACGVSFYWQQKTVNMNLPNQFSINWERVATQTSHILIITDCAHKIVWISKGFTQLSGMTLTQALDRDICGLQALNPHASNLSNTETLEQMYQAKQNRQIFRGELQVQSAANLPVWLDVEISPLFDDTGAHQGFREFAVDITALRLAKDTLALERDRINLLAEGIEAGLGHWNLTSDTVNLDARLAQMLGDDPADWANAAGLAWRNRCHPDDFANLLITFKKIFKNEAAQINCELRMRHREQRWITMLVRAHVSQFAADGKPSRVSGIYLDVTQARMQDARWQARAELSADWFWSSDQQHNMTEVSSGLSLLTGVDANCLLGQPVAQAGFGGEIVGDGSVPKAAFAMQVPFKGVVFSCVKADGNQIWIEIDGRPIFDFHGEFIGFEGVGRDITYKREQEQALVLAKDAAEAANVAKSAFLATMSHEIRTPMNGVLGMAEMLSTSPLSEDQSESVDIIRQSAASLLSLIDDILDFSKIDASRIEMEERSIGLPDVVFGVVDSLLPISLTKGVKLRTFVDPQLPARVLLDDTRLRQILNNLLGNAIKFSSGEAGKVGCVYLRVLAGDNKKIRISVEDNGIGIASTEIEKVFHVFNQAERSTTRRFGGTGLGLAITKRLVELMGGTIRVQSELGTGSVFITELPLKPDGSGVVPATNRLDGKHCVIIGANATQNDDLSMTLSFAGAKVICAADLKEAQAHLKFVGRPTILVHASPGSMERQYTKVVKTLPWPADVFHLLLSDGGRKSLRMIDDTISCVDWNKPAVLCNAVAMVSSDRKQIAIRAKNANSGMGSALSRLTQQAKLSSSLKILVAEDDPINQLVIRKQLQHLGVTPEIVENGRLAFDKWLSCRDYSILLTDLHMPEMDGYELTRQIRANETQGEHLPILALTANAVTGETFEAFQSGIDIYLTKPILLDDLYAAVSTFAIDYGDQSVPAQPSMEALVDPVKQTTSFDHFSADSLSAVVGDDVATMIELLDAYAEEAQKLVTGLASALQDAKHNERRSIAHRLKSSSRSVGALWMGELCSHIERLGEFHSQVDADGLAENLLQAFVDFKAALPVRV